MYYCHLIEVVVTTGQLNSHPPELSSFLKTERQKIEKMCGRCVVREHKACPQMCGMVNGMRKEQQGTRDHISFFSVAA